MRGPYELVKLKYGFWAKLRCRLGLHTPGIFYPRNPKEERVFYWGCCHCDEISQGGKVGHYYIDSDNYGEKGIPISVSELKKIVAYDREQPADLADSESYKKMSLQQIKEYYENPEKKATLTRRDAIEWLCYSYYAKYRRISPRMREWLEKLTTEQVGVEYNRYFAPIWLKPVYFEVIDGEHQLHPLPTSFTELRERQLPQEE